MSKRNKKHGDKITFQISNSTSNNALLWINNQRKLSESIRLLIEREAITSGVEDIIEKAYQEVVKNKKSYSKERTVSPNYLKYQETNTNPEEDQHYPNSHQKNDHNIGNLLTDKKVNTHDW